MGVVCLAVEIAAHRPLLVPGPLPEQCPACLMDGVIADSFVYSNFPASTACERPAMPTLKVSSTVPRARRLPVIFAFAVRLLLVCLGMVCPQVWANDSAETPIYYETEIRPILKANCFHCHGEEEHPQGGLDLRLVRLMRVGGESGPSLVDRDPSASVLWQRIESDEMPEGPKKLSASQKAIIRRWIEQGAMTRHEEPTDPEAARFTREELSHWAFQPIQKPAVPESDEHPVDAFLLDALHRWGVEDFSPTADRRTLIRRLTLNLHGLPPTPDEVQDFLQDASDDAYERVVDRLLASPRYGERWGRHWLDVAGYAETNGNSGTDRARPFAWKYRDYVIDSLNRDKPYDQFLREQIAGDELAPRPWNLTDPRTIELLTATGFLRMAPDVTEELDTRTDRNQAIADVIKVVSSAAMGLTLGCAQCHDHRYDPIPQADYYRFRAVFDPAFNLDQWKKPGERLIDATSPADNARAEEIEAEAMRLDEALARERRDHATGIYNRLKDGLPDDERDAVIAAVHAPDDKLTEEQKELRIKYPMVKTIEFVDGFLEEYDRPQWTKFEDRKKAIAKLRDTKPQRNMLMIPAENADVAVETRLFFRGDPDQPKQAVTPGDLIAVSQRRESSDLQPAPGIEGSTGRRLALAERLTDGQHPLTARVIVNRVWLLHFGQGLVNTPGEFGINGERPSHPELLDWLASTFMEEGWSLKRLHKQLLMTRAYRQTSLRRPNVEQFDVDNRLLSRMNVRRLEAEAVRDSLLAVAGLLNPQMYGPSVPVTEDDLGRGVFGSREVRGFSAIVPVAKDQQLRRSLYAEGVRGSPLTMLATFDMPVMQPNCDLRRNSTAPPQSLLFLNDEEVVHLADQLTERLWAERENDSERIDRAFELLYSAIPSDDERAIMLSFLTGQTEYFRTHGSEEWLKSVEQWPHAPAMRAMAALCQTLMSANRFLYVD